MGATCYWQPSGDAGEGEEGEGLEQPGMLEQALDAGLARKLSLPKIDRPRAEGTEATSIKDQKPAARSASDGIDQVAAGNTGAVTLISQEQQREAAAGDGAVPLLLQERRLSKSRKSVVSKVRNSFSFMSSKNLVGKKTSTTADSTAAGTNQTVDVAM